jgi:hypothetical protein
MSDSLFYASGIKFFVDEALSCANIYQSFITN